MLLGCEARIKGVSWCYSHGLSCVSDTAPGRMGSWPRTSGDRYVVETAPFY
jgi:hypothetical protein